MPAAARPIPALVLPCGPLVIPALTHAHPGGLRRSSRNCSALRVLWWAARRSGPPWSSERMRATLCPSWRAVCGST